MKRKFSLQLTILLVVCAGALWGCAGSGPLDPTRPVTLTMWHNFGGDMQQTMDTLIDEFNSTVGKETGVIINVTAISSSSELQEKLNMIAGEEPGAPEMPDLFTAYPKTAVQFQSQNKLANLDAYFNERELAEYVDAFVQEGRLGDGGLYVFPFAKSTEVMYLNRTLFDRFSAATGVTMSALSTLEGIADAAALYTEWSGGKAFFSADSWLNFVMVGMRQQGASLFENERLSVNSPAFERVWNPVFGAAAQGGIAVYDGYSSDLSKTGDLVCSTGSTAGILFYGDTITYADNTVEQVEYTILPYPTVSGGQKVALQRGNGFCVAKSDDAKEYAASVFLKWFTRADQNMRFVSSTGYLPVTREAFENRMRNEIDLVTDGRIKKMLIAATEMYRDYEFFTAPSFTSFDADGKAFQTRFKAALGDGRTAVLADAKTDLSALTAAALNAFRGQQ